MHISYSPSFQMSKTAKQNKGDCGHWMPALDNHGGAVVVRGIIFVLFQRCGARLRGPRCSPNLTLRGRQRGVRRTPEGVKSTAKGKNTKTATSQANSRDVAVSSSSRESTTGTVSTVSVRAPSVVIDEKALLADPCYNKQHGGLRV